MFIGIYIINMLALAYIHGSEIVQFPRKPPALHIGSSTVSLGTQRAIVDAKIEYAAKPGPPALMLI